MDGFIQKLARTLALLATMVSAEASAAASALAEIPQEILEEFAADSGLDTWEPEDRRRLMHLLATDSRVGIRKQLAAFAARCPLPLDDADNDWLMTVAADAEASVRSAFVEGLTTLLRRAGQLDRASIISSWALSPREPVRLALALALHTPLEAIGVRTALDHLARDPSATVRDAARNAALPARAHT